MAIAASGKPAGWLASTRNIAKLFARFARDHLANILTVFRLLAIIPLIWALTKERFDLALMIFIMAAITDALDGWYAKATSTCSNLGALLDPIADKSIVAVSLLALAWLGALPFWFVIILILREALMAIGYAALRLRLGNWVAVTPSFAGKCATALELTLIGLSLLHLTAPLDLAIAIWSIATATVVALAIASYAYGIDFSQIWRRQKPMSRSDYISRVFQP